MPAATQRRVVLARSRGRPQVACVGRIRRRAADGTSASTAATERENPLRTSSIQSVRDRQPRSQAARTASPRLAGVLGRRPRVSVRLTRRAPRPDGHPARAELFQRPPRRARRALDDAHLRPPRSASLACGAALIACGSASSRRRSCGARPPRAPRGDREPGRRVAAAGHARRVAEHARSASSARAGTTRLRVTVQGLAQRLAQRRAALLLDGHRRELHPEQARSGQARRSRVPAQVTGGRARGTATTSFTIAHQYAPSQNQFPINPGDASASAALRARAPSLTPSRSASDHARQARRGTRLPVPRALPGQGHARRR